MKQTRQGIKKRKQERENSEQGTLIIGENKWNINNENGIEPDQEKSERQIKHFIQKILQNQGRFWVLHVYVPFILTECIRHRPY